MGSPNAEDWHANHAKHRLTCTCGDTLSGDNIADQLLELWRLCHAECTSQKPNALAETPGPI